jgi:hypothetical protein
MPNTRVPVDLAVWHDQIVVWFAASWTLEDVRTAIKNITEVSFSKRTFQRRLQELHISPRPCIQYSTALRTRITYIFSALRLTDAATIEILNIDGFKLSIRTLRRIRKEMGLLKRLRLDDAEELIQYLIMLVATELDNNDASNFGRGNFYTYMRSKYNIVGR